MNIIIPLHIFFYLKPSRRTYVNYDLRFEYYVVKYNYELVDLYKRKECKPQYLTTRSRTA